SGTSQGMASSAYGTAVAQALLPPARGRPFREESCHASVHAGDDHPCPAHPVAAGLAGGAGGGRPGPPAAGRHPGGHPGSGLAGEAAAARTRRPPSPSPLLKHHVNNDTAPGVGALPPAHRFKRVRLSRLPVRTSSSSTNVPEDPLLVTRSRSPSTTTVARCWY